jgi:hypothetical protein
VAVLLGLGGKWTRTSFLEPTADEPEGLVEALIQSVEKRESRLVPV